MYSFYFSGLSGKLLVTHYLPEHPQKPHAWVLVFPAFAEEMNKCRSMVSAQARSLMVAGLSVVVPDLYGTGDSEGDFVDADWSVWRTDMQRLIEWIRGQGANSISFLGIRAGCLLAADVAMTLDQPPDKIVCWQPVSDGKQAITQFLRLKVAAEMMNGGQVTVGDLRALVEKRKKLEVAGYEISHSLIHEIDQLTLEGLMNHTQNLFWLEVVANKNKPLPLGSRKKVDALVANGQPIKSSTVAGDAFWSTQEITHVPELITATTNILSEIEGSSSTAISVKQNSLIDNVNGNERVVQFSCQGSNLVGVLHQPESVIRRGIVLVVGGPQYRIGSHRQFVRLSRALATQGYAVFRFDYRGMGDSEGELKGFEYIADDINSAINAFCHELPVIEKVVICGLCDAASAAAFYAPQDLRVEGLVLINPWVRSEQGAAKAYLKHYYWERIFSAGFLEKVWKGKFDYMGSAKSFWNMILQAGASKRNRSKDIRKAGPDLLASSASLSDRMFRSLNAFSGQTLFVLSGNDLTAAEFKETVNASKAFSRLLRKNRFRTEHLDEADHTFSKQEWRNKVIDHTLSWLSSW